MNGMLRVIGSRTFRRVHDYQNSEVDNRDSLIGQEIPEINKNQMLLVDPVRSVTRRRLDFRHGPTLDPSIVFVPDSNVNLNNGFVFGGGKHFAFRLRLLEV